MIVTADFADEWPRPAMDLCYAYLIVCVWLNFVANSKVPPEIVPNLKDCVKNIKFKTLSEANMWRASRIMV